MSAGSSPVSLVFFQRISPFYAREKEREELLLVHVVMQGAFCCVHEASVAAVSHGMTDVSNSCLCSYVQRQSQGQRFPVVLWDVPGYGSLKPQAHVLRLGNMWLKYDGSNVGWKWGREFIIS